MDIEKALTAFGLPGVLVLVWYLLQVAKGKRDEKEADIKAKLEEKRLAVEEAKVAAMTVGFQSLGSKLDHHTTVDLAHHAKVAESIAKLDGKIDGVLDQADRFTPVQSVPLSRKES